MTETDELVRRSLADSTGATFAERVAEQAGRLRTAIAAGEFDSPGFAVGLELEGYAVGQPIDSDARLQPLPDPVFDGPANKELGVHNVELNTDPDVFDSAGLDRQRGAIADSVAAVRAAATDWGQEIALDAMWTIPPSGGSRTHLGETEDRNGVTVATNMRADPRYVALDNDSLRHAGGRIPLDVPGATIEFPGILFESLTTSIQPHLQIPAAEALPAHYNAAIRTLGPVLALAANSPFLPPDLYDVDDPERLVAETPHELRIPVFEQSVNHTANPKVRVPRDIAEPAEVVDRVVTDDRLAPFLREWVADRPREGVADRLWEFDYKRSTYWRWLRCVPGGDPVGGGDERSLRIEYRPLPTQPTVRDVVAFQALTAGLIRGLVAADHPLTTLPWSDAEASFYAAVADGPAADLTWVTADGDRTADTDVVFDEVLTYARRGLREAGLSGATADDYLAPVEARAETGTTPSSWKKASVRERLRDGASLAEAITGTQRTYLQLSRTSESFAEWF
ncbi:MAG: hypothetical protein ABEH56_00965 [Salinirussus sp.]